VTPIPGTLAPVVATPVATPVNPTATAAAPHKGVTRDKRFWVRVGSGMALGVLLLTVLALLLPG
jgi:hypothetical protein